MIDPNSVVLSPEEIYAITHDERPKEQLAELQAMGIPARLRKTDHTVCVLRAHVTNPISMLTAWGSSRPIKPLTQGQIAGGNRNCSDAATRQAMDKSEREMLPPVHLRWMLLPVFCALTGYTEKAVRRKIGEGIWLQGRHFRKAPDGHITMDLQAYYAWVEGQDH